MYMDSFIWGGEGWVKGDICLLFNLLNIIVYLPKLSAKMLISTYSHYRW